MEILGFFEKKFIPDYKNIDQIKWAEIIINHNKCSGCRLCSQACPADSITISNKKAAPKPLNGTLLKEPGLNQCMGCGDCIAICPKNAIKFKSSYKWTRYFKTINRGELSLPRL